MNWIPKAALAVVPVLLLGACGSDDAKVERIGTDTTAADDETTTSAEDPDASDEPSGSGSLADDIIEQIPGARGELLAAAATSTDESSARMAMSVAMGSMLSVEAEAVVDFESGDSEIVMDMSSIAALAQEQGEDIGDPDELLVEMRTVDGTMYMKMPPTLAGLTFGGGTEWVAIDQEALAGASGMSAQELQSLQGQTDPSQYLSYLRGASDDVEVVGDEQVRGADTTHYTGTLDLGSSLDDLDPETREQIDEELPGGSELDELFTQMGLDEVPFDAWVDDEGRMRKMAIEMDLLDAMREQLGDDVPEGMAEQMLGEMSITIEMYDYGVDVDVEAPPASDVTELDSEALDGTVTS